MTTDTDTLGPPRTSSRRPGLAQKESVQHVVQHAAHAGLAVGGLYRRQPSAGLGVDHGALGRHHDQPAAVHGRPISARTSVARVAVPRDGLAARLAFRPACGEARFARWRAGLAATYAVLVILPFERQHAHLAHRQSWSRWSSASCSAMLLNACPATNGRCADVGCWSAWLVAFCPWCCSSCKALRRATAWLPEIGSNLWGGLLLTFMLSLVSIIASFPLGVLLALGRRSHLPAVSIFSTLYIELVRGVPLVTILYMAQIMVPLFLPGQMRIANVVRVIVGMTLFTAAYLAENVRGGLQAIPPGRSKRRKRWD